MNTVERERLILSHVVKHFITTGNPVGSRTLSKILPVEWSAATVRNVMADLEEKGFLQHPHVSAGRIPTDLAYRTYVDTMMNVEELTEEDKSRVTQAIQNIAMQVHRLSDGMEEVLFHTSRALAAISSELGIVLAPRFNATVVEKIKLIRTADNRIVIDLALKNGIARTVILDVQSRIENEDLRNIEVMLNERLSGLSVSEIRESLPERMRDARSRFHEDALVFIQVFLESASRVFGFEQSMMLDFAGTHNILSKPEFSNQEGVYPILQLLEDRSSLMQILMSRPHPEGGVHVTIGEENTGINRCSIVTSTYSVGSVTGTLGIIGPTRMPYSRIIPLVRFTARTLENNFNSN